MTGDTVIVPVGEVVVAIDADTGSELWRHRWLDHASASDGFVVGYLGSGPSQQASALDAFTGQTLWTVPGRPSYGDLWGAG